MEGRLRQLQDLYDTGATPYAVTFRGSDYSCGGTVNSVEDITRLGNEIITELEAMAKASPYADARRDVGRFLEEVVTKGLKVYDVRIVGPVPAALAERPEVGHIE